VTVATVTGGAPRASRGVLALIALFLLSLPAVTARIYASDEVQYYSYLRSLWFDRDLSFDNEYQHFYDAGNTRTQGFHETFLERTNEAGRRINFATIGCAILWSPFYAVGDAVAHASGAPADGYSRPYVAAVAYASALYGFLALLLSIASLRRAGGDGSALSKMATPAALAVWVGTPLLFYMYVAPPMSHATSAFAVALFVYAWLRVRERWTPTGCAVLGALAALMAMVREQDAFFVAGPALDLAAWWLRAERPARRRVIVGLGVGLLAFIVCYLPQAIAYESLNGHLGPTRLVSRKMTWTAPHALEVVVSPRHGFFVWTPLAAAALLALAWFPRTARALPLASVFTAGLVAMVLLQVYVAGSVESWTVAGAFGQRRFIGLTTILVFGIAAALAAADAWARRVWAVALALCVWWNLGVMAQFGAGLMDRQRLEPARIAYTSFVVLPRELPRLAWRYLFDRRSFYQAPPGPTDASRP
jgi:hypothetical protein